jgi:hypothetical protein
LGSAASLAIAAPIAEGDVSQAAHTHAARTGWFFPTATSIGVVTNAVERMRIYADGGVQIGGTYGASLARLYIETVAATTGVVVRGDVAQASNLQEWQDNVGNILSSISSIGYFRAPYGSAGAPGLSFQGDPDNGMFRPASNTVGIATAGVECMRFYADGGVQVGGAYGNSPGLSVLRVSANVTAALPALPADTRISVIGADGANARVLVSTFGTGVTSALSGRAARGTAAVPTALQSGDTLVEYGGWGYGATGFSADDRAAMKFVTSQIWTDAAQGSYISFWNTSDGAIVDTERLRINNTSSNPGILQVTDNIATVPTLSTIGVQNAIGNFYYTTGSNNDSAAISARAERSGNTGTRMAFFGRAYDTGTVGANSKGYGLLGQSAVATRGTAAVQIVGVYGNASIGTGSPSFSAGAQDTNLPVGSNWFAGVAGVSLGVGAASSINVGVYGRAANALENYAGYFDGAVVAALGTVALPAYSFIGDPNTGIYATAADAIGVSTNGVLRLTVSTTSIQPTLTIRGIDGTLSAPTYAFSSDTNTGIYRPLANTIGFVTGATEKVRFYTDGGVQIGGTFTTSPGVNNLRVTGAVLVSTVATTPSADVHVVAETNCNIRVDGYGSGATSGFQTYRARGTVAAPTAVQTNDSLGFFGGYGWGTSFSTTSRAKLEFKAAETWTGSAQGTYLGLFTTPIGSTTIAERLRIYADGGVQIGGTYTASLGAGTLQVAGLVKFDAADNHAITQVAINTALDATHYTILVDASGGAITIDLPDSTVTANINGRVYNVKKIDGSANAVTVQRAGASDQIDGATTSVLTVQYQTRTYQCRTASAAANRWSII